LPTDAFVCFMCGERAATPAKLTAYDLSMKKMNEHCQLKENVRESRRFQLDKGGIKNVKRWGCHIAKDVLKRRRARSMLYINCVFCRKMIGEV
jgi:hypothetical protein